MTTLKTRARIFVLVILAAFPALLFTVYSVVERRASTENQARAEAGDVVLKAIAGLLKGKVRGSGIACRYGARNSR